MLALATTRRRDREGIIKIPEVDLARKRGVVNAMIQLVIYQCPEERSSVVSRNP